jgi:putative acetyltransferase
MAVSVSVESPLQDEVRQLIGELNQALLALTPAEFCYHMTAEEMARSDTTVFVAREDGAAVACGALRRHGDGVGVGLQHLADERRALELPAREVDADRERLLARILLLPQTRRR